MTTLTNPPPIATDTQLGLRPARKAPVSMEPLNTAALHRFPNHHRVNEFAKTLRVPKGRGAHQPFLLRPWQRDICAGLFPGQGPRPRQGLVSIPRANGKSTIGAVLALYGLLADDATSPQVLCIASDLRQASIVWNTCRRMIELSPDLIKRCRIYSDKIVVPATDGILMPMPSTPEALFGWDPTLVIVDELHVVPHEAWESMLLASGKRERSLVLAISTPADSDLSCMWSLVRLAREEPSPDFYFREYTSDPSHATDCQHCWTLANPALGDFLSLDSMASVRRTSRENAFRRFRLGQWLDSAEDSWITPAQLKPLSTGKPIPDGSEVVLAVDGSFSQDCTAIAAATVSTTPHIDALRLWGPPANDDGRYRVPINDVEEALRQACRRYRVREIAFDPFRFTRTMQALAAERLPVIEFPQTPARMTPATTGLYEAVVNHAVTHSGNADLTRHILNARVTEDSRGTRLHKDRQDSANKIDLAVCAVMAHARATHLATKKTRRRAVAW